MVFLCSHSQHFVEKAEFTWFRSKTLRCHMAQFVYKTVLKQKGQKSNARIGHGITSVMVEPFLRVSVFRFLAKTGWHKLLSHGETGRKPEKRLWFCFPQRSYWKQNHLPEKQESHFELSSPCESNSIKRVMTAERSVSSCFFRSAITLRMQSPLCALYLSKTEKCSPRKQNLRSLALQVLRNERLTRNDYFKEELGDFSLWTQSTTVPSKQVLRCE